MTVAHHHAGLKRDAASIWLEDITRSSFKICLRELQNYAGSMRTSMSYVAYFIFCLLTSFSQYYICCALSCVKLHNVANFLFLSIFLFLFFVSFRRTGWLFRHLTSPCSQNTAQFILQTLRSLQPGIITHSARSV